MAKGKIGVTSQDIFPLIKKFMYNDHDIFIREIVSNAVDASQKLITLINSNEFSYNIDDLKVTVTLDKDLHTISVKDNGIGMSSDEVEKYINQIAFSGATEFLEKYKDTNIIGHFGLGFYSSFMVSDKVTIETVSYKDNRTCTKWICDGTTEYEMSYETIPDDVLDPYIQGTTVIMHIADEFVDEYLNTYKIKSLLERYAKYLPVKVYFEEIIADTTNASTNEVIKHEPEVKQISSDNAIWTKQPSTLTDEDYINFYKETYPGRPEPLFWIHINIDMPFTFTGVLYFPSFDYNKPIFEKKHLSLYCNRVFVTDNVEGILPDYLGLLHGIIDSPDIPLNVSRSFLQSDPNVKKISTHITSKVMSSLKTLMKKDREKYEEKWDTIKTFINLGVITVGDVFEKAKDIILLTDIDNKKYTFDEYFDKVSEIQKDKDGKIIYLYTYDVNTQYTYIEQLKELGYNILLFNSQYSAFEVHAFEVELRDKNIEFRRIDSNTIDKLIEKEDTEDSKKKKELPTNLKDMLVTLFESIDVKLDKIRTEFIVESLGKDSLPITIIADEWFRRMKEMSTLNNGGMFINEDTKIKFIINSDSKVVKKILKNSEKEIGEDINNINTVLESLNSQIETNKDKEDTVKSLKEEVDKELLHKEEVIKTYANKDEHISELIDIALLQYGLLGGENLSKFIKKTIKIIEK